MVQIQFFCKTWKLSQPINKLSYNPGGSVGSTVSIWKVPQQRGINEVMNDALKVIEHLNQSYQNIIPVV